MTTPNANQVHWNDRYHWADSGEEWSSYWGTSEAQWFASILPRIRGFVTAGTILEIAPGFGRWTTFLKDLCDHLIVVYIAEKCIAACRRRFERESHIEYHVNDGQSLDMVPDRTVDFAFSFDSLVHVEADTISAYLAQLARKLTPDGVAFLHHSNIGEYKDYFARLDKLGPVRRPLARAGLVPETGHGRRRSMTAEKFLHFAREAGLLLREPGAGQLDHAPLVPDRQLLRRDHAGIEVRSALSTGEEPRVHARGEAHRRAGRVTRAHPDPLRVR